jgi:heptosyltransferase-2
MQPRRILVRLPNWVGDAVMATPALRALRQGQPDAEIALWGRPPLEELLSGLSCYDSFRPVARGLRAILDEVRELRRHPCDWAVLLPDSQRSALAPFLAGVPRRVGYARERVRRALLNEALDPPQQGGVRIPISMVERYLAITRRVGCEDRGTDLALAVDDSSLESLECELRRRGVGADEALLVVTPGASFGSSKLWPPEHFAAACDGISRRLGLLPVLAPGPGEVEIARAVCERTRERSVLLLDPVIGLGQLVALVARSRLVLSNDTGPRHIAVALGRPVVVLMGPTDPRHTAHQLEGQRVLRLELDCSPCGLARCPIDHPCMRDLAPVRAIEAAAELLA